MPPIAAPIAAALIAGGSQLVSNLLGQGAQNKQNAANMQLAAYQFEQNKEMWNLQNAYNDPSAQMARLKAAGLNPNMIYGSGGGQTQSAPAPRYERPEASFIPLQIPQMLSAYQDFRLKEAQIKTTEEQARIRNVQYYLDRETRPLKFDQIRSDSQLAEVRRRLATFLEPYQASIGMSRERIENARVTQADADALYAKYRAEWMKLGITGSDSIIIRIIARMLGQSGFSIQDFFKGQ